MPNEENNIILEFPATNVEIELGETITFDNISGFLDSGRVTYNGESLTEEIAHLEDSKADQTYVDTELGKKADKSNTYTKSEVDMLIDNLPEPMIFKGTLGVGGTIQSLPTASASNEGYTYKVITDGTYAGQTAKVGDSFTSDGSAWVLFPCGDTDTDTWRAIKVNGTEELGSGISSGSVDFVGSENIDIEFDNDGNKIGVKTKNIYTKEEVDDIVYDILPDDTASGSVANFTTSLELPIKSLGIDVNAVQESGTPTPATPLPISGWNEIRLVHCGKNLIEIDNLINRPFWGTNEPNIVDAINKLPTGTYTISNKYKINELPSNGKVDHGRIYITAMVNGTQVPVTTYNVTTDNSPFVGKVYQESGTFVITEENKGKINHAYLYCDQNATHSGTGRGNYDFYDIQLELSSTISNYEPYVGDEYIINLGGTYYGGHFTQDKVGHRQFELTCVKETVSLQGKTYSTANGYDAWLIYLSNRSVPAANSTNKKCSVCGTYQYEGSSANQEHFYITSNALAIYLTENTFRDGSFEFVYPLETPIIIDLPDGEPITTFIGTNNIYADTGDCAVEFKVSVEQYVEKKIASVQALILNG